MQAAPGLPGDWRMCSQLEQDKRVATLMECACRLVTTRTVEGNGVGNLSLLVYPSITVSLDSVDSALAHAGLPAVAVDGRGVDGADDGQLSGWHILALQLLKSGGRAVLSRLPGPWHALSHAPPAPTLLAWHWRQPLLAIGHSSTGAVLLFDTAAAAAAPAPAAGAAVLSQPRQVLTHQLQQQVSSLAWRPVHTSMLAVGCCGGVGLWSLGKLPLSAGSQAGGWVTFLDLKQGCRVSCLSWSPDGTKLAGASTGSNRLVVWDAALGVGSKLRLGLVPVHLLAWSPDGHFLFAADRAGSFYLYETATWSVKRWESPPGTAVTGAAWAPDSSVLLLSLAGSSSLVGLHIVGSPPHQTEQMLPVALPGVSDVELPKAAGPDAAAPAPSCISAIAWDPSGSRLAVVLAAPHPAAGSVALFATSCSPVVTAALIGYVQPGQQNEGEGEGGDGGDDEQLQVAFAPAPGRNKAAGLLSVGVCSRGGAVSRVRNVPLYF